MKKWTAITIRDILSENKRLTAEIKKNLELRFPGELLDDKRLYYQIESRTLLDTRFQNLAISLDKINIFLKKSLEKERLKAMRQKHRSEDDGNGSTVPLANLV